MSVVGPAASAALGLYPVPHCRGSVQVYPFEVGGRSAERPSVHPHRPVCRLWPLVVQMPAVVEQGRRAWRNEAISPLSMLNAARSLSTGGPDMRVGKTPRPVIVPTWSRSSLSSTLVRRRRGVAEQLVHRVVAEERRDRLPTGGGCAVTLYGVRRAEPRALESGLHGRRHQEASPTTINESRPDGGATGVWNVERIPEAAPAAGPGLSMRRARRGGEEPRADPVKEDQRRNAGKEKFAGRVMSARKVKAARPPPAVTARAVAIGQPAGGGPGEEEPEGEGHHVDAGPRAGSSRTSSRATGSQIPCSQMIRMNCIPPRPIDEEQPRRCCRR